MTTSGTARTLPALMVYAREECHLCHDMIATLRKMQTDVPLGPYSPFTLDIIDVDDDSDLQARYGALVPVLMADGKEICHYHLDMAALEQVLGRP